MTDTQAQLVHSRIWDLLSDYADIRDELEDALESCRILYSDLELAMEDIADELDAIEDHLSKTARALKRFRAADTAPTPRTDEEEELPWS